MRSPHTKIALLLLALSSPAFAAEPEGAEMAPSVEMNTDTNMSEEALADARIHFTNGVELIQATPPNYQDAYYQFQLALEKSGGSWTVRGNLGFAALKLERDGEALVHYREYLEKGGDEVDPVERDTINKELLLLQGNLATAQVSSSDPEAQITVERDGSPAPVQSYDLSEGKAELGLRAGSFTITARSGEEVLTWNPVLTPGKSFAHEFDFAPEPAPSKETEAPVPAPAPAKSEPSKLQWAGYATAAAGILALGGGLVTGLIAKSNEDGAKEDCIGLICPGDASSEKDTAESLAGITNVLFIAGGVLAATGITLILIGDDSSSESSASLQLSPSPTPNGGGLTAWGTF